MEKESHIKILESIEKGEKRIGHERSEEAILIIGPSGAGKSTTMATLKQLPLIALIDDETGDIIIDSDQNKGELEGLIIEHKAQAGTAFPKKFIIDEKCFWDTPGFQDNKGHYQDLANAFFLRKIINTTSKIKLIFTTMHSHLETRAKVFLDSLRLFCKAFGEKAEYIDSVGLIITNTPSNLNSSHILNKIQKNILNTTELELDQDTKEFLKHLINNPNKIILMPTPNPSTDLTKFYSNFRRDVFELIRKLKSISISNPNLIISDETKNKLPNIMKKKAEGLEDAVKQAHHQIKNFLDKSFSAVKFDSSLKLGLIRVAQSKMLVKYFEDAKKNHDVDELYELFKKNYLDLTSVENIKNTIECAKLFRDINPKIKLDFYKKTMCKEPFNLNALFKDKEAELPLQYNQYVTKEFQKWVQNFKEKSKLRKYEKKIDKIFNVFVESSRANNFRNFFKTINTYKDLACDKQVKDLDAVIDTIQIFTDSQSEKDSSDELNKMQDTLIKESVSTLEETIHRLKTKGDSTKMRIDDSDYENLKQQLGQKQNSCFYLKLIIALLVFVIFKRG